MSRSQSQPETTAEQNARRRKSAHEALDKLLNEACRKGFFGKIILEAASQDGELNRPKVTRTNFVD